MAGEAVRLPRRSVEPSYARALANELAALRSDVRALQRGATLRNASISGGDGLKVYSPSGNLRISLNTADGAVVGYDEAGEPAVRMGELSGSAPGEYGVEVLVGSTWVQLGVETTTWDQVGGKPSSYPSAPHTHPGGDVTSAVANATNATEAVHAAQADGSASGFARTIGGSEFYALWVDNTAGFKFGRNTSSLKYKTNVRPADLGERALGLEPVVYDRKPTENRPVTADGEPAEGPIQVIPGAKNELGLIAESVAEVLPELVTYYQGEIDGVRYDLVAVALLDLVKDQGRRIVELENRMNQLTGGNP